MTYAKTGVGENFSSSGGNPLRNRDSSVAHAASASAAEAAEFELWVSEQATSLAKLKVFHSMAKSVNDQQ